METNDVENTRFRIATKRESRATSITTLLGQLVAIAITLSSSAVQANLACSYRAGGRLIGTGGTALEACQHWYAAWAAEDPTVPSNHGGDPTVTVSAGGSDCLVDWPDGTQNYTEVRRLCSVDKYYDRPYDTCPAKNPPKGNPIYPLTGAKRQDIDLGVQLLGEPLRLGYDTRTRIPGAPADEIGTPQQKAAFGPLWESNWHKSMVLQTAEPGGGYGNVVLRRGASIRTSAGVSGFDSCSTGGSGNNGGSEINYVPTVELSQKIKYSGGAGQLLDAEALTLERYAIDGAIVDLNRARGGVLTYNYSDSSTPANEAPIAGLLIQVGDSFGRTVKFRYEQPVDASQSPRVVLITAPDGLIIRLDYDANGYLRTLTWPDGTVRTFTYEQSGLPWALTGVVDENNKRHSNYTYDNVGRATSTELAGGVDRYTVSYPGGQAAAWSVTEVPGVNILCREHRWVAPTGTTLTLPNGQSSAMQAGITQGMVGLTNQSQPAGSGCTASTSAQDYDPNGNVNQIDDFSGTRTCYANDLTRNLQTVRIEGLANTQACSASTPANAALPTGSRKVSTKWHPDWRLSTTVAEPGRITTSIYNGQPDPFNGGAATSCAPSTALLPDGKSIAVLCKQVEQATTDADGHLGFSAGLQSGVANRQTTWTYNQYGQVLTEDGPRTDVSDVTTYTYYSDASFTGEGAAAQGHFIGDLQSVTNAAGKVTSYSKYNRHGQLLESTDPNGVLTVNTYDLRQRLLSSTVGGQTTSYAYDPVGQLKKVTLPDASWIGYDYDDAHRQIAVYDHKGNRTEYKLDNAGNRTGETTKDPNGALKRQLSRSIDALGRVQQTTGRE